MGDVQHRQVEPLRQVNGTHVVDFARDDLIDIDNIEREEGEPTMFVSAPKRGAPTP